MKSNLKKPRIFWKTRIFSNVVAGLPGPSPLNNIGKIPDNEIYIISDHNNLEKVLEKIIDGLERKPKIVKFFPEKS